MGNDDSYVVDFFAGLAQQKATLEK